MIVHFNLFPRMRFRMGYADVDQAATDTKNKNAGMEKLTGSGSALRGCFGDRRMILFIVFVALFLDNMLLTTVGKYRKMYPQTLVYL